MMEIDDKLAYRVHGLETSESESDSDGAREFDEEYELMKPPPYNYELIKDRIVLISAQKTPEVLNIWENQVTKISDNNEKENEIRIVSNLTLATNNVIPNEFNEAQYGAAQIYNKKTRRENKFSHARFSFSSDTSSQKNETFRKFRSKNHGPRINEVREKNRLGMEIKTKEELVKEFPSLDEAYNNNFRRDNIKKANAATSSDASSRKKKKQFKPLQIDVYFGEDTSMDGFGKTKKNNKKNMKHNFNNMKLEHDVPSTMNKISGNKVKRKNVAKQIMKKPLNTTRNEMSNINTTNADFEHARASVRNRNGGTLKKSNLFVDKSVTNLLDEYLINVIEECDQNNLKENCVVKTTGDYAEAVTKAREELVLGEEKRDHDHPLSNAFEQLIVELRADPNEKLNNELNEFAKNQVNIAMQQKDHSKKESDIQKINVNCNVRSDIQDNVNAGHESGLMNIDSEPTLTFGNEFPGEIREFLQNIVYEGTTVSDLNSFTDEQLQLAYVAYEKKHQTDSSLKKDDNIIKKQSSGNKTSENKKFDQKNQKKPNAKRKSNQKKTNDVKNSDQRKKPDKKQITSKPPVYQLDSNCYPDFNLNIDVREYLENIPKDVNLQTVVIHPFFAPERDLCDQVKYLMEDNLRKYSKMLVAHATVYMDCYIYYVNYVNRNYNFLKDRNVVGYLPAININIYLGLNSLTYISKTKLKLKNN